MVNDKVNGMANVMVNPSTGRASGKDASPWGPNIRACLLHNVVFCRVASLRGDRRSEDMPEGTPRV